MQGRDRNTRYESGSDRERRGGEAEDGPIGRGEHCRAFTSDSGCALLMTYNQVTATYTLVTVTYTPVGVYTGDIYTVTYSLVTYTPVTVHPTDSGVHPTDSDAHPSG